MAIGRCLLLSAIALSLSAQSPIVSLTAYSGKWRVVRDGADPAAKPDRLQNSCAALGTYFACQQTINGAVGGVLLFIPANTAGHFITQNVLPSGRASGAGELSIEANPGPMRWTFSSSWNNGAKTIRYRTIEAFTNRNQIDFQQQESDDNGKSWRTTGSGKYLRDTQAP